MTKTAKLASAFLCVALLAGCASSLSRQSTVSSRSDVFVTIGDNVPVAQGRSDLNIFASIKTHKEFDCPINLQHAHGTADYKLVLNIDGQSVTIDGAMKDENLSHAAIGNPEEGDGVRYSFRQRLSINPGEHRIIVSLPGEGIAIERTITVTAGLNTLAIEPLYNRRNGVAQKRGAEDFHEGIRALRTVMNGTPVN